MSEWKGKQSWVRPRDHRKYWERYDNIDFTKGKKPPDLPIPPKQKYESKPSSTGGFLFLDDVRMPSSAYAYSHNQYLLAASGIPYGSWDIVRSYEEFVKYIEEKGIPAVVSFDNDLYHNGNPSCTERVKSGCDCARYLVERCKELQREIPVYYIHSANQQARLVIERTMEIGRKQINTRTS
jgi:hypothetical protein